MLVDSNDERAAFTADMLADIAVQVFNTRDYHAIRMEHIANATPCSDRSADTHHRVPHDKIEEAGSVTLRVAGQLRHIGVGRTYAGTDIILLVQDLHVTVMNAATGEILRDLIIDPRKGCQPTGRPPGPAKK